MAAEPAAAPQRPESPTGKSYKKSYERNGKTSRAALAKTRGRNRSRPQGLLRRALREVLHLDAMTVRHAQQAVRGVADQAERPYVRARQFLNDRPIAALGIGAGVGLGLGLLLWAGYEIEREPVRG